MDVNCGRPSKYTQSPERVVLNIRGSRFETFERTLQEYPETLLGNTEKRRMYYNSERMEYYFDRDTQSFDAILFYYQSRGILSKPDVVTEKVFEEELKFYDIKSTVEDELKDIRGKIDVLPTHEWQRVIWVFLEQSDSSRQAKFFSRISILVVILSIIAFCAESIYVDAYKEPTELLDARGNTTGPGSTGNQAYKAVSRPRTWFWIDTVITVWFCSEYLARFISCPHKFKFVFSYLSLIDVLAILPYFMSLTVKPSYKHTVTLTALRIFRLLRVSRVLKLTRHIAALRILGYTIRFCHHQLISLAILLVVSVVMFSSVMYYIECEEKDTKFTSIFESFWWCIITMTTVGYGDISPTTLLGKVVGALCAVFGVVVMLCLPTPVFILNFNRIYCKFLGIEMKDPGLTGVQRKRIRPMPMVSRTGRRLVRRREASTELLLSG